MRLLILLLLISCKVQLQNAEVDNTIDEDVVGAGTTTKRYNTNDYRLQPIADWYVSQSHNPRLLDNISINFATVGDEIANVSEEVPLCLTYPDHSVDIILHPYCSYSLFRLELCTIRAISKCTEGSRADKLLTTLNIAGTTQAYPIFLSFTNDGLPYPQVMFSYFCHKYELLDAHFNNDYRALQAIPDARTFNCHGVMRSVPSVKTYYDGYDPLEF